MLWKQSVIAFAELFNGLGDRSAGEDAAWMPPGPARGEQGRGRLASRSAFGLRDGFIPPSLMRYVTLAVLSGEEHIG